MDTSGCVIGINTAIFSTSGANTGVGFAIPGSVVRSSVNQILTYGKVVRPALGIAFAPDQSSESLGVKGGVLWIRIRNWICICAPGYNFKILMPAPLLS